MENKDICSKCKGKCCKTMGCHFSPSDFNDLTFEGLKKEIDKGYISIDWWEGNPFDEADYSIDRALFLRIKNVNAPIVDASWGGQCCLLTFNGCKLSYDKRPKGGRELIPRENEKCIQKYTKNNCAKDWYKYNDILLELESYYNNISFRGLKEFISKKIGGN